MNTPHKHAALIKAWAEGHQLQMRIRGDGGAKWANISLQQLLDLSYDDELDTEVYRIKPASAVLFCRVSKMNADVVGVWGSNVGTPPVKVNEADRILRLEFDPDTLELVSATMEKV